MIVLTTDAFPQATKSKEIMKNRPYPFEINDHDGHYSMTAQIESAELFNNYNPLFGGMDILEMDIAGRGISSRYLKRLTRDY